MTELSTLRLRLRHWRESDLKPFAELNGDPEVMRYFPTALTRAQSDELASILQEALKRQGWGLWAVEVSGVAPFIGFVGLNTVTFEAHFTPAVEVGWRLARRHWGHGYATEAARAALNFGFDLLGNEEIVSFTAKVNTPSTRVMRRLGMKHDPADDFDHPSVTGRRLRRHVLYRILREEWYGRPPAVGE